MRVIARKILLPVFLLALCALFLSLRHTFDTFDANAEGIINVHTAAAYGESEEGEEAQYYCIAAGERIMPCEAFTADDMTVYYVPHGCFELDIGGDRNRVLCVEVTDEKGNPCDAPEIMEAIFRQIAQLEHDLFTVRIFDINGEYFAYVELNVNWWTPCSIYYYNQRTDKLVELYTFDNEMIQGIHILSKERLHAL